MRAPSLFSVRRDVAAAKAGAVLLPLLAAALASVAPAGAARLTSPLTVPAVSLLDVSPHERSLVLSIARGSAATTDEGAVGIAGVHLPDGARATALAAFAIDENATQNFEARLFRRRIGTALVDGTEMAFVLSGGSSAAMQELRDGSLADATIDNSRYIYWVAARLPDATELFGIQVEFLAPLLVDGFESGDMSAWSATVP